MQRSYSKGCPPLGKMNQKKGTVKKSRSPATASAMRHWLKKSKRNGCTQLSVQPFCGIIEFLTNEVTNGFWCLTDCKIPEMVYDVSVFPHQRYLILRSISVVIFAIVRQFYEMDIVFIRIVRNDRPVFEVLTFVAI